MQYKQLLSLSTLAASLVILLGAGCTAQTATSTNTDAVSDANTTTGNINTAVVANTNVAVTDDSGEVDLSSGGLPQEDTSDWLTYSNEEYGFSFKYPQEWELNDYSQTEMFINIPNQVLRLQLSSDQTEYHMILYKDSLENIITGIKNHDPSASFVKAENDISINGRSYKYISIMAAIGSLYDYYVQNYGTEYVLVWIANPYTDQNIIKTWISTFR